MYSDSSYTDVMPELTPSYEEQAHASDIPLPPGMATVLLGVWIIICLAGFFVMFVMKERFIGTLIIGVPTFFAMVIRPTFGLCLFMLVLPTGTGVAVEGVFTLSKGVGLAYAASFLLNLLISQAKLKISSKALWLATAYFCWTICSLSVNSDASYLLKLILSKFQYLGFLLVIYLTLTSNGDKTLVWCLRSYVVGTLGTIVLAIVTGAAIRSVEQESEGRYTATLGNVINANHLAALVALAFLAAIYLIIRDKKIFWRLIYLGGILFLPVMLLKIGSRGTIVALVATCISPLLFVKQAWQKPSLTIFLIFLVAIVALSAGYYLKSGRLDVKVEERLTDINYARQSLADRMAFNRAAIRIATRRFTGTGHFKWFERASASHYPHNDFFFVLGIYGWPAALLWFMMIISTMLSIKRAPLSLEKIYTRSILFFLLIIGLKGMYVGMKFYWLFLAIIWAIEEYGLMTPDQSEYDELGYSENDTYPESLPLESGL